MERRTEILELDERQVAAAVRGVLPEAQVLEFRLAGEGKANTNYVVDTSQRRFVLRLHARAGAAGRAKERAVQRLVRGRVPAPAYVGYVEACRESAAG
jgi:Ser/Thr protein kinase RdoA (MazF antagonist)